MALYADAECPNEEKRARRMGWGIGRQMVSQYVVEMLLQIGLKQQGVHRTETHNLARLYGKLLEDDKNMVEKVYKRILHAEVASTWDVYETVASFFDFLGQNPVKRTRYPWQPGEEGTRSTHPEATEHSHTRSLSHCTGTRSPRARWISATIRNSLHSRNPVRIATIARGTGLRNSESASCP